MKKKLLLLKKHILRYSKVGVAFSGGVDSTFLLKCAIDTLGAKNVYAFTVRNSLSASKEMRHAAFLAKTLQVKHTIFDISLLDNARFNKNPKDRCYVCKKKIFMLLKKEAQAAGCEVLFDGTNSDDMKEFRPGNKASEELGIIRPLALAGLRKAEIRKLSRDFKLVTWNQPAQTCLATRFPYGWKLTENEIETIGSFEHYFATLGFSLFRIRRCKEGVRIEVSEGEFKKICNQETRKKIVAMGRRLGYQRITLDLAEYKSGSMDQFFHVS